MAYHLTGRSIDGSELYHVVVDIIKQVSAIDLKVVAVTSDMGPSNRVMWRKAGIESKRDSLVSCIGNHHPTTNDKVHFLADVPHVLKNLRSGWLSHKTIVLSPLTCTANNLPSREVQLSHVKAFVDLQSAHDLLLAPKLSNSSIDVSSEHFDKMNVGSAMHLFSKSVSAGLKYLVEKEGYSRDMLTTA